MINVKYNKEELKDKILACWIGKNIGGTIGGPYECQTQMLDITGFSSKAGEPLPNDDLDLQLGWLMALERFGPRLLDANVLGETWLTMITPNWNEYGIGKKNLKLGLLPPLCGEYDNDKWKHSNGAWIRSEVWACLAPGFPNVAIKYAIMDASIDHGMGEGLYAEIFTAALESIAFTEKNIRKTIETALSFITPDCRVAKCIKLVLDEYDKGTPYRDVRNMLVESTKDLGWFQAPANVGFAVIGLMYGEGDFKKSMIYAVNCGDDTDCTAATVGAFLGILGGTAGIPDDWREYIGDRIMQICLSGHHNGMIPKTCTELTDRVLKQIPLMLKEHNVEAELCDVNEYDREQAFWVLNGYSARYLNRSRYSFDIGDAKHIAATVEYESEPVVKPFESFNVKINFKAIGYDSEVLQGDVKLIMPEGWTAEYRKTVHVVRDWDLYWTKEQNISGRTQNEYTFSITPNDNIAPKNNVRMIVESEGLLTPFIIPLTLLG